MVYKKGEIMKKVLMSVLALGAISSSVYAECVSGWCSDVEVTRLLTTVDGNILVATSGDESALACTSPGNEYMTLSKDDPGQKNLYSLLLTAKTTKTKVMIRTEDSSSNCRILFAY